MDYYTQWGRNPSNYPQYTTGQDYGRPQQVGDQYRFPWDNNPDLGKMWNDRDFLQRLREWTQNMLPWDQFRQNQDQYNRDFGENQRRWNQQFDWTKLGDMFNQDMMRRQMGNSEWQMRQQQDNWLKQFGLDEEGMRRKFELDNRNATNQDWYNRRTTDIDDRWKTGQLQNQQAQMRQDAENVRMQAFGRTQAPNAKFMRSWG